MTDAQRTCLKNCFLLNDVPEAVDCLAAQQPTEFPKGATIYNATAWEQALGIVLQGKAVAYNTTGTTVLNEFGPGDVFGAAALFGDECPYVTTVLAGTRCRVLFVSQPQLTDLMMSYPVLAVNYIAFLSAKVRLLNRKIALFTGGSVKEKVYAALLGRGNAPLNRQHLAKQLNIGRTSLYRALEELEKDGSIEIKDRKVVCI